MPIEEGEVFTDPNGYAIRSSQPTSSSCDQPYPGLNDRFGNESRQPSYPTHT